MSIEVDAAVLFPLYVIAKDCGDVLRFDSVHELSYLEAVDVRNGEYEGYDSRGRILLLNATEDRLMRGGDILISVSKEIVDRTKFEQICSRAEKVK